MSKNVETNVKPNNDWQGVTAWANHLKPTGQVNTSDLAARAAKLYGEERSCSSGLGIR